MFRIFSGYLTGLSVGVYCLATCLPVFLPILLAQRRDTKKSFSLVIEFSVGRLLGYLAFGLIIGGLGQLIQNQTIHLIIALANIWTGILMILYSLGAINQKFCSAIPFHRIKWPLLLGFLTGANICPPFLASLTHVFNLESALAAMAYFLFFFLGTSTYIIPAAFLGVFTRRGWVQQLARVSGVLMGWYFVVRNLSFFW